MVPNQLWKVLGSLCGALLLFGNIIPQAWFNLKWIQTQRLRCYRSLPSANKYAPTTWSGEEAIVHSWFCTLLYLLHVSISYCHVRSWWERWLYWHLIFMSFQINVFSFKKRLLATRTKYQPEPSWRPSKQTINSKHTSIVPLEWGRSTRRSVLQLLRTRLLPWVRWEGGGGGDFVGMIFPKLLPPLRPTNPFTEHRKCEKAKRLNAVIRNTDCLLNI